MGALEELMAAVRSDPRVLAVLLYGSRARGTWTEESDVDVCLVAAPGFDEAGGDAALRVDYLPFPELDLRFFHTLPLYVRQRVLEDGKVLFVRDEPALYDVASRTVFEFEDFEPHYRAYLETVARG